MHPTCLPFSVLFASLLAPAQEQAPHTMPLLGAWVSTAADGERLEFRADGVLVVDGDELQWRAAGNRLALTAAGTILRGTWEVDGAELTIALRTPDGEHRTQRYRRPEPARAGSAVFDLPAGWTIARRDGDRVLLNPGLRAADTLHALVVVFSGPFSEEAPDQDVADLLRAQAGALAAELAAQEIDIDPASCDVRAVRLRRGAGAELRAAGRAAAGPVCVWLGATRDAHRFGAVLVVALAGREQPFLQGARQVLDSLAFEPPAAVHGAAGTELAGLEFGNSTFGGGSSLTTVYAFGAGGALRQRTMFASSFGDSDRTDGGTFAVRGDVVTLHVGDDVTEARIQRSGGEIVALRIGGAVYRRL